MMETEKKTNPPSTEEHESSNSQSDEEQDENTQKNPEKRLDIQEATGNDSPSLGNNIFDVGTLQAIDEELPSISSQSSAGMAYSLTPSISDNNSSSPKHDSLENNEGSKNPMSSTVNVPYYPTEITAMSFPELLKTHTTQMIPVFEFGEAIRRSAQANIKCARNRTNTHKEDQAKHKFSCENAIKKTEKDNEDENAVPKIASEVDHKTPHSNKRLRLLKSRKNSANAATTPRSAYDDDDDDESKKTIITHLIGDGGGTRTMPAVLRIHPECFEIWNFMVSKEEASLSLRNARLFADFKTVTPRMRAILLDWLMEVCEVYHLRRVTYYLGVDYFDRFLTIRPDIPKGLLQLVGISCLYIASKVEEVYPPNLNEFSYVCDGACQTEDIVSCEVLILNSLGWEVIVTTPSDWLNLYMQINKKMPDVVCKRLGLTFNNDFVYPQYSPYYFTRASNLIDLTSLDPIFLKYSYSIIAAAAMAHIFSKDDAIEASGILWEEIEPCFDYMSPFLQTLKNSNDPRLESCGSLSDSEESCRLTNLGINKGRNERYAIQTHVANIDYFEKTTLYRLSCLTGLPEKRYHDIINNTKNEEETEKVDEGSRESLEDAADSKKSIDKTGSFISIDEILEMIVHEPTSEQ